VVSNEGWLIPWGSDSIAYASEQSMRSIKQDARRQIAMKSYYSLLNILDAYSQFHFVAATGVLVIFASDEFDHL